MEINVSGRVISSILKSLSISLLLAVNIGASADEVSVVKARQVAENFFSSVPSSKSQTSEIVLKWTGESLLTKSYSASSPFYVFENTSGGFVIISGDDCLQPILGYSYDSSFRTEGMPSNISHWFSTLKDGINHIRNTGCIPDGRTSSLWEDFMSGQGQPDGDMTPVLYETALWNQGSPYSRKLSKYGPYTGCGALAMAIIMRYFSYPECGQGEVGGYSYIDMSGRNVYVEKHTLGDSYDWDNMPLKYYSDKEELHPVYTEVQADAVSDLIFDCALALESQFYGDYGTSSSDYSYASALKDHMGYDWGMTLCDRRSYSTAQWLEMIYSNLREVGPVWYSGTDPAEGGHTFVVDGFDSRGNLHVNWGWGGNDNGYYAFPDMNGFEEYQTAVLGIKPFESEENSGSMLVLADYNGIDGLELYGTSHVTKNQPFQVIIGILMNYGMFDFNGEIILGLVDINGDLKQNLGNLMTFDDGPLSSSYGWAGEKIDAEITCDIESGDAIMLLYRDSVSGDWKFLTAGKDSGVNDRIYVGDEVNIGEKTSFEYDALARTVTIITYPEIKWEILDKDDTAVLSGLSDQSGRIVVSRDDIMPGEYFFRISSPAGSGCFTLVL